MILQDLFIIQNGVSSSKVNIFNEYSDNSVIYIRPASTMRRTIAGWLDKSSVPMDKIYPKDTLFVSTDGEGSHTYAYVSTTDFVPNSNVAVLIPKQEITLHQKLFYAHVITMNRYRFSYGRKPKGSRLMNINIPSLDEIPNWVNEVNLTPFSEVEKPITSNIQIELDTQDWQPFEYHTLFDIRRGTRLTKANMTVGSTPFIGSTDSNNGLTNSVGQRALQKGNVLTLNYNGSVGECFYQPIDFWASDDVNTLYPRPKYFPRFNALIAMFLIPCIKVEKYRFNYGRKWHTERMKTSVIKLPVTSSGELDLDLMENYIKSLPFSSQL